MTKMAESSKNQVDAQKLATRHAFLDTEVFNKLKHNPANRALKLLAEHVAARRLVVHICDITLAEIARQIGDFVDVTRAEIAKVGKDINRWRHTVPDLAPMPVLGDDTASQLFSAFRKAAADEWRVKEHKALQFPTSAIFSDYFARNPPFDKAGSKEFPDAFVLHTLEAWCKANRERMYIVGKDAAMARFADRSDCLLSIDTIEALLASANASSEDDRDTDQIADALLNAPAFDHYFEEALGEKIDQLVLVYSGDLPEGEVTDFSFNGEVNSISYQIVSRTSERIGLIAHVPVELAIDVTYEDRRYAAYDKEDDVWIGGETDTAEIEDYVGLELYLELEIASGKITALEFTRTEFYVR